MFQLDEDPIDKFFVNNSQLSEIIKYKKFTKNVALSRSGYSSSHHESLDDNTTNTSIDHEHKS